MKSVLFLFLFLGIVFVLLTYFLHTSLMSSIIDWIHKYPTLGGFYYGTAFTLAILLGFPTTLFELTSGYLFGWSTGVLIAGSGKLLGCCLSFLIGRTCCQKRLEKKLLMEFPAIASSMMKLSLENPVKTMMLLRASTFPMALKNYGVACLLPYITFPIFVSCTVTIGGVYTVVWCYVGSIAPSWDEMKSGSHPLEWVLCAIGILSMIVIVYWIGKMTGAYIEDQIIGKNVGERRLLENDTEEEVNV